jgi:cytosine/adenosine deaminase-related metal-dependent hydrolase
MDEHLGELECCDLLIEGSQIAAIEPRLHVDDAEIIEADGKILMPGLVDGHRHVWEFIDIGQIVKIRPAPFLPSYQDWKMRTIVSMEPEDHYLAELGGALQAIDSGVTTVVDYAHGQRSAAHALAAARGLKDAGIGGWFAFQLGVSSSYRPGETVGLARATAERISPAQETHFQTLEMLRAKIFSDSSSVLQLAAAPSGNNGTDLVTIRREWQRLRSANIGLLAQHIHQPAQHHAFGTMGFRGSGIEDLHEAGLLAPDLQVVHANSLTDTELQHLRDSGAMLCATPMGEFTYVLSPKKGPPIHGRATEKGISVAIGNDVPLAVPSDYFEHIRAAYWSLYLDHARLDIASTCTPDQILSYATRSGAAACGLGDVTGSLTVGKRADLLLLDPRRAGFGTAGSLAGRVVTFAASTDVDSVWVAGVPRKRNKALVDVVWGPLLMRLADAQKRISAKASTVTITQ